MSEEATIAEATPQPPAGQPEAPPAAESPVAESAPLPDAPPRKTLAELLSESMPDEGGEEDGEPADPVEPQAEPPAEPPAESAPKPALVEPPWKKHWQERQERKAQRKAQAQQPAQSAASSPEVESLRAELATLKQMIAGNAPLPSDPFEAASVTAQKLGLTLPQYYERLTERMANEGQPGPNEVMAAAKTAEERLEKKLSALEKANEERDKREQQQTAAYHRQQGIETGVAHMKRYLDANKDHAPWRAYVPDEWLEEELFKLVVDAVDGQEITTDHHIAGDLDKRFRPLYERIIANQGQGNPAALGAEKPAQGQGNPVGTSEKPVANGGARTRSRTVSNRTAAGSSGPYRKQTPEEKALAFRQALSKIGT